MMNHRMVVAAFLALALVCGVALAADAPKSGPQVGQNLPGPFHPLNITNAEKPEACGQKNCLVCQHGINPVAMVFARQVDNNLTMLIKKLDAEVGKNKAAHMGGFVVLLTDDQNAEKQLKKIADEHGIKNISLAVDNPAGPPKYNVAREADITVVLYNKQKVQANHTFTKGGLNEKAIEKVVADVPKILD
jgi:hypothetical protein